MSNISLNQALSTIRPAEMASQRFARESVYLRDLKQMYEEDTQRNADAESKFEEQLGLVDASVSLLSERGQQEMQAVVEETKKRMEEDMKKYGSMDQYMRHGGQRQIMQYKNSILNDERFRGHLKSQASIQEVQELMKAGKGSMVSHSTRRDMQRYLNGEIDRFDTKIINPINIPEDKYYEDVPIALASILAENYGEVRANYAVEFPDMEPTDENLLAYLDTYYGAALGKKIDIQKQIALKKAGRRGTTGKDPMQGKYHTYGRNVTAMFMNGYKRNDIGFGNNSLRNYIEGEGWNIALPIQLNTQRTKWNTDSGNYLEEAYKMTDHMGRRLFDGVMEGERVDEEGNFIINTGDLYDEDGIYSGGVDTESENIRGQFEGVYFTKGNDNSQDPVTGKSQSILYITNEDKKKASDAEEGYKNKLDAETPGHPVMVAAIRDKDTGKLYYKKIQAEQAATTGLMEKQWGDMNKLDDDITWKQQEQAVEQMYKAQDNAQMESAKALYDQELASSVDRDLGHRNLSFSANLYAGVISALTASTMGAMPELQGLEGEEYNNAYKMVFKATQDELKNQLLYSEDWMHKLEMASNDNEARDILMQYLQKAEPQNYETLRKWSTKYTLKYNS